MSGFLTPDGWMRWFLLLLLCRSAVMAATEVHLSPGGHDGASAARLDPLRTPQEARTRVRALRQGGVRGRIDVVFAAGTYHMDAPLELTPEDSGTADGPTSWRATDGAEVVLSGGRPISGRWTMGAGGIWHTDLAGTGLGAGQWNFRQLFVNGHRATRARFPNARAANPFLYATGGGIDHVIVPANRLKASWGTAVDAQINMVPQSRFFNQWNTVTAVNPATGRISLADSERHRSINSGSWFWIEGVAEELDEPGEWFLDPVSGRLSYYPDPGVDPNQLSFVAPYLQRLITVRGDVHAGTHVRQVHFERLGFCHTDFTLGHIEARVHTDAAILFENTSDSSVRQCEFTNIGGYALWLHLDSQRNEFDGNAVTHSGGGGVLATGARFAYMDDTKIYTPGEAAARVFPILNRITRNSVEHCGRIRYYGGGVHLDSRPFSMSMAPGNYIAHNHFRDLSRNGVFAFRNQGGNVIEYNHIHDCMQTTIDGAAIHFATMNTISAPNFLLNNWLYDIWGWSQQPNGVPTRSLGNGVFLDWDTSNTTVKDNWIYNSVGGAVKVIFGGNRNVVNTGNPSSSTPIAPPFATEVGPAGTATNQIDLASNRLTGSILSYRDNLQFSRSGVWNEETAVGLVGLFEFRFLAGTAAVPSEARYEFSVPEDGTYEISLIYYPGTNRASNVPVTMVHADGVTNLRWNMRQGSAYGFAVPVGTWRFEVGRPGRVSLSTAGTDGKVIADSVGFVKVQPNEPPVAGSVQVVGAAVVGSRLSGRYQYNDVGNDLEGLSRFQWYRGQETAFDAGSMAIPGATGRDYAVSAADVGMHLFFEVTPVALTGVTLGTPVVSSATDRVLANAAPTASAVRLEGVAQAGVPVTAAYVYADADGDPEGVSLLRWYRSADPLLDAGDTVVAGIMEVVPALVKTSGAFSSLRLAGNLFNAAGLNATGQEFFNLNGSQPGEPTGADGISWLTPSGGEDGLLSQRRAWLVADLGSSHKISQLRIWNFQWAHSTGDLSNRGVARFDVLYRNAAADTVDGTTTASPINGEGTAAAFQMGTAQPWQTALSGQDLGRAPNADGYPGQLYPLAGQIARFIAIVPTAYYGGNGIGLGKMRIQAGQPTLQYVPAAADIGQYLIFEVTPIALSGLAMGLPVWTSSAKIGSAPNAPPVAGSVRIAGNAEPGATLTGTYQYADADGDAESGTILRWLRSADAVPDAGDAVVGSGASHAVSAADAGHTLFFAVTPRAAAGAVEGATAFSAGLTVVAQPDPGWKLLVEERFAGSTGSLQGSPADHFAAVLAAAGGSALWNASSAFLQNGTVVAGGASGSASLALGSYLNQAKGTPSGRFALTLTIGECTGTWLSVGFAQEANPGTARDFTGTGNGSATTGMATVIRRSISAIPANELDGFGGPGNGQVRDGPDSLPGKRTITVTLDLTPNGGYNGSGNHGTVHFADSAHNGGQPFASHTYSADVNWRAVLISENGSSGGTIESMTLRQLVPVGGFAGWISGFGVGPLNGLADDPDGDGMGNGVENLLGSRPDVPGTGISVVSLEGRSVRIRHTLNPAPAADLRGLYQWSSDLQTWRESGESDGSTTVVFGAPVEVAAGTPRLVETSAEVSGAPLARLYVRFTARLQ
jgi:hypothetical protein